MLKPRSPEAHMQQTPPIGWDPISINSTPPWEFKFFVLYLLVVVTLSLVKFVSLGRQLWSFRRSSMPKSCGDGEQADLLAASALRGALPSQVVDRAAGESIAPPLMRKVEGEFVYKWEVCSAKSQSMKRLVVLTFLLSVLAGAYRART